MVAVVDLGPMHLGPSQRVAVAAALDRSFAATGFAIVVGHGLPDGCAARARRALQRAFALPVPVKERYRSPALGTAGWVPFGMEANGYAFGEPTPPDLKETFVFSAADLPGERPAVPNVWPAEVPELRDAMLAYLEAVERVHTELLMLCALALGVDEQYFVARSARATNTLNANWYPPLTDTGAPQRGQFRIGPHTDFGTLTLLDRQPGLGGLQVRVDDGWCDAPWVPDCLTVNCGDLLALWSSGRWRSAVHRVLPPDVAAPDESLLSLVYFCEPDADTVVAPLPGRPADDFAPVRAGDHLQAKLDEITMT